MRFDVEAEELVRGSDGFCERCEPDEAGELLIQISGSDALRGLHQSRVRSEKKILRDAFVKGDAYFRTGDLLRIDEDGFYYFVDRIGDTFRWKGENVATSEVAEVISVDAGVDEANVYGVAIAGQDGRAGMAALVANASLRPRSHLRRRSIAASPPTLVPSSCASFREMEITGTFKHRKVDLVREGFDPARIPDALYFRDPALGRYVPLDAKSHEVILSGRLSSLGVALES